MFDAFENCELLIADSLAHVYYARQNGLAEDVSVLTEAPAIHQDSSIDAISYGSFVSSQKIEDLRCSTDQFCQDLLNDLTTDGTLKKFIPTVLRQACATQNLLVKIAALDGSFCKKHVVILHSLNDKVMLPMWQQIFAGCSNISFVGIPEEKGIKKPQKSKVLKPFLHLKDWIFSSYREMQVHSMQGATFTIVKYVSHLFALCTSKPKVWVYDDSFMIRAVALKLAFRGVPVVYIRKEVEKFIANNKAKGVVSSVQEVEFIMQVLSKTIDAYAKRWAHKKFSTNFASILSKKIKGGLLDYVRTESLWQDFVKSNKATCNSLKAVLTILPKHSLHFAMFNWCSEQNIPVISFQHGVSRELSENPLSVRAMSEATASHYFVTYNNQAAMLSDSSPFAVAKAHAFGVSHDYYAGQKPQKTSVFPEVFFVSTCVYSGNLGIIKGSITDSQAARQEIKVLKRILGMIPKKVLYKSYPSGGFYTDPDPVLEVARSLSNVTMYEKDINLMHLFVYAKVIITSRATSTLGWCIMSHKPIVYLEMEGSVALKPEVYEDLKKAIFVFKVGDEASHAQVVQFMSQPIEIIEKAYAEKQSARNAFIKNYVSSHEQGAEEKVTDFVQNIINNTIEV